MEGTLEPPSDILEFARRLRRDVDWRQVLDAIWMHNPERLRRNADAEGGNQMAKVAAVRGLELMQSEAEEHSPAYRGTMPQVAGMTIIIEGRSPAHAIPSDASESLTIAYREPQPPPLVLVVQISAQS